MALYYCYQCKRSLSVKGTFYLSLDLSDGNERFTATWFVDGNPKEFTRKFVRANVLKKGEFFNISGQIEVLEDYKVPVDSPLCNLNLQTSVSLEEALNLVKDIRNQLPPLYKAFLSKSRVMGLFTRYKEYPAGLSVHHDITGGLLQHVVEMLQAAQGLMNVPYLQDVMWAHVVIGVLYHDWGKLVEYDVESWDVTPEYPLLGHIYMSASKLQAELTEFSDPVEGKFTQREIECMVHCVLAHHMNREWGSPVVPATIEATIVHYVDNISAKAYMFSHAQEMQQNKWIGTTVIKNTI